MSLSWSGLHAQLLRSTHRQSFEQDYRRVQDRLPVDLRPSEVPDLLAFLHGPGPDPETKNRVLRALVAAAQDSCFEASTTLLLLALWPGLDAVRSRLRRAYPRFRDTLDTELVGRLTVAIGTCDLDRVNRFAATLLRNVERDVTRALIGAETESPSSTPLDQMIDHLSETPAFSSATPAIEIDSTASRERLRELLGRDAHLVLMVVVGGCSQREAAEMLGLSYETARKRFRRTIARLQKLTADCPIS